MYVFYVHTYVCSYVVGVYGCGSAGERMWGYKCRCGVGECELHFTPLSGVAV